MWVALDFNRRSTDARSVEAGTITVELCRSRVFLRHRFLGH